MSTLEMPAPFRAASIDFEGGSRRYALLEPADPVGGDRYPLVLFLHGAGERGSDPAQVLAHFPVLMAGPYRSTHPAYVVAPQCSEGKYWARIHWQDRDATMAAEPGTMMRLAMAILDQSLAELPVDPARIYLTGLSMGGFGCWEWAIRQPSRFAAIAPVCGGGDPHQVQAIKDLPIWAFHSIDDDVVDVEHSRRMISALRAAGGNPRYSEFQEAGHHSWEPAYDPASGLLDWMFQQRLDPDTTGRRP